MARSRPTSMPEMGRGLLAEQQPVQRPGAQQDERAPDRHERQRRRQLRPGGRVEAAEQVGEDLAQGRARHVHRHGQSRGEQRADGVAGQQQAGQRRQPADPRQAVDRVDGGQRTDERQSLQQAEPEDHDADRQQHRDRRPERRARGGSEDVRVGQRIAQQPLEGRSGHRQGHPDDHRGQHPRDAKVPDDRLGRRRPGSPQVEPEQPVGDDRQRVERGDGDAADGDAEADHDHEGGETSSAEQDRPAPAAPDPADAGSSRYERAALGRHRVRAPAGSARPTGWRRPGGWSWRAARGPRRDADPAASRSGRRSAGSRLP